MDIDGHKSSSIVGWRWLVQDTSDNLLLAPIAFGSQIFRSIVLVMSILIAFPTSIVQNIAIS